MSEEPNKEMIDFLENSVFKPSNNSIEHHFASSERLLAPKVELDVIVKTMQGHRMQDLHIALGLLVAVHFSMSKAKRTRMVHHERRITNLVFAAQPKIAQVVDSINSILQDEKLLCGYKSALDLGRAYYKDKDPDKVLIIDFVENYPYLFTV